MSVKPKHLFYGLGGALVAMVIAGLFLYVSAHQKLGEKINTLEVVTADVVLAREHIEKLQALEGQYAELVPLIEKGNNILPPQKEQAEALAVLAELVGNSGLNVQNISFEQTSGLPSDTSQTQKSNLNNILVMPVNINTSPGTYAQLQILLRSIENNERHMQVKTLDISRTQDDKLAFSIKIDTYLSR
ncbi:MAG: type 4a pilus biogenesis protein PilO [Candidatus Saccharimonadales bacterium]